MDATAFVQDGAINQGISEYSPIMQQIQQEYPVLAQHPFFVRPGDGLDNAPGGYSETYPKWESENPNPGFHTIALFDKGKALQPNQLKQLLLGESFHVLGGVDPTTEEPVDPKWFAYKQRFLDSLTPEQIQGDLRDYSDLNQRGITYPSVAHYYQNNRLDAYFRGKLSPINDEEAQDWGSTYTPDQLKILDEAKQYLQSGGK